MNEELRKLRKSMDLAEAKIPFLKEGVDEVDEAFKTIDADLEAFVDVYDETQRRNEERIERLEKHVDLT